MTLEQLTRALQRAAANPEHVWERRRTEAAVLLLEYINDMSVTEAYVSVVHPRPHGARAGQGEG